MKSPDDMPAQGPEMAPDSEIDRLFPGLRELTELIHTGDPDIDAQNARVLLVTTGVLLRDNAGVEAPQETPDELFSSMPLSGGEAKTSLISVLDSIEGEVAENVRGHFSLPQPEEDEPATKVTEKEEGDGFTEEEAPIAALVIAGALDTAAKAIEQAKFVRAGSLWENPETRAYIEEAVLNSDTLATGTPEERKALVASVYAKLPRLMRQTFETRQSATSKAA